MSENLTAISYLISAIFFILALKGLSHPESAKKWEYHGYNWNGHCHCNYSV